MKIIGILLIALLVCIGIYTLVDQVYDGRVAEWFYYNFINSVETYDPETGQVTYFAATPIWPAIKALVYYVVIFAVIGIVAVAVFAYSRGKKAGEKQLFQIQEEMERKEQLLKIEASRKNDLITYLAHDLKTPLTSVIGYLSLLDEIPEMPQKQRAKYVNITLDKAKRLEKLINEFFEITRYNFQSITLEKERVDLNYMLVQMMDEFYPILAAHENIGELEADEGIQILADPERLARVFNNILKNAVAYSYPGTPIRVAAGRIRGMVWITFTNQGPTIPPQKVDAIFEKFFRLDDARTSNSGGAGLGLAIAREIVTLHGGTITASSENEVTEFRVTLPL